MSLNHYYIAFYTIFIREVLRFSRIWVQTIVPPVITTILYFVIFGQLIGDRIGEMDGYRYIEFIIPGLILMTVISNSYANVVSSFYSSKFQRHVEELLVSPVPDFIILAGYVAGGMARGVIVGIVVTTVSLYFVDLKVESYGVTLLVFLLTSMLFSIAGFINAIYADSFDAISIVPTFILTPLTYLGGVFYSVSLLPEFWQQVSYLNPILYMVNAFRFGLLGVADIELNVALSLIVVFIMVLIFFALYLLKRGIGIRD